MLEALLSETPSDSMLRSILRVRLRDGGIRESSPAFVPTTYHSSSSHPRQKPLLLPRPLPIPLQHPT